MSLLMRDATLPLIIEIFRLRFDLRRRHIAASPPHAD